MSFERCRRGGFEGWRSNLGETEVFFGGKGPEGLDLGPALGRIVPEGVEKSWLKQVHSATVLEARPGNCGPGDGLVTRRKDLALAVVTADCVPVLLAGERIVAAVHAGWRGIAQSILPEAVKRLNERSTGPVTAWIGPAIGPCCYEVGDDVAGKVCAVSSQDVAITGPRGRPHLDLAQAARIQLKRSGTVRVSTVGVCTRCNENHLWSYRREGPGAGRNIAAIWNRSDS